MSMFKPKYIKHSLFGQTWPPIAVFLILYYIMLILYDSLPTKADCLDPLGKTKHNHTSWTQFCGIFEQEGFKSAVKDWKDYHKSLVKILSLLLGFYVSTMMRRWWTQITHLPKIEDIAMTLNGLVISGSDFDCDWKTQNA